jgi:hypothetical protein
MLRLLRRLADKEEQGTAHADFLKVQRECQRQHKNVLNQVSPKRILHKILAGAKGNGISAISLNL